MAVRPLSRQEVSSSDIVTINILICNRASGPAATSMQDGLRISGMQAGLWLLEGAVHLGRGLS